MERLLPPSKMKELRNFHISWNLQVLVIPCWVHNKILSDPDPVLSKCWNNTFYLKIEFSKLISTSTCQRYYLKLVVLYKITLPLMLSQCCCHDITWHYFYDSVWAKIWKKVEKLLTSSKHIWLWVLILFLEKYFQTRCPPCFCNCTFKCYHRFKFGTNLSWYLLT